MFNNNSVSSKSEQVAEQVFEPLKIPVIIGNEVYVVTQQDVRNIIETRYLSCTKCPNGIKDLQSCNKENSMGARLFPGNVQFAVQEMPPVTNNSGVPNLPFNIDLLNAAANFIQCHCVNNQTAATMMAQQQGRQGVANGMSVLLEQQVAANPNTIAPISTQLDWEMRGQPEIPSQLRYCKKTSTSDLKDYSKKQRTSMRAYNPRRLLKILISKGVSTCSGEIIEELEKQHEISDCEMQPITAKELLKQKKEQSQL